jgi:hypothetical protein
MFPRPSPTPIVGNVWEVYQTKFKLSLNPEKNFHGSQRTKFQEKSVGGCAAAHLRQRAATAEL